MLCTVASTAALAQVAGTPMRVRDFTKIDFTVSRPGPGPKDTTTYSSYVHGLALSGIVFTDTGAVKQLVFKQAEEIWDKTGREWIRIHNFADPKITTEQKKANHTLRRDLLNKLLPELRLLVSVAQQATFDRNLKALQASDYTVTVLDVDDNDTGREAPLIECRPVAVCWPDGFPPR